MARKSRVSVPNGIYHVTSRIVNREMWFGDAQVKDEIVGWLYATAMFSGVDILSWTIMDNHFHLFVNVPSVPMQYWDRPDFEPESYAFGMRPPECNAQLWENPASEGNLRKPTAGDSPCQIVPVNCVYGDSPCGSHCKQSAPVDCVPGDSPLQEERQGGIMPVACPPEYDGNICHAADDLVSRPKTGFMLSDEEMLERLAYLYQDERRIKAIRASWARQREEGNGAAVDAVKERYCRRMYNLSQFVKTFKERVALVVKRKIGHAGCVFESRFWSGLVEEDEVVKQLVSLYIDYNPYKAKIVKDGEFYRWSSFGQACSGGVHAAECRAAYERLYGRTWEEVRRQIEAVFAERIPEKVRLELEAGKLKATVAQFIKMGWKILSRSAFIGRTASFAEVATSCLPSKFPKASLRQLQILVARLAWKEISAA